MNTLKHFFDLHLASQAMDIHLNPQLHREVHQAGEKTLILKFKTTVQIGGTNGAICVSGKGLTRKK